MRKLGHALIAAAALLTYGAVLWWATHSPPTLWKPPPQPRTSEPDGPVMPALPAAPLVFQVVDDADRPCALLTETKDDDGRRVVVDFDCIRAKWPDASITFNDRGVSVMLDELALCASGPALRCVVR